MDTWTNAINGDTAKPLMSLAYTPGVQLAVDEGRPTNQRPTVSPWFDVRYPKICTIVGDRWLELNRCVNAQIGLGPYPRINKCSGSTWNGNEPACWEVTSRVSIPSQKQSTIIAGVLCMQHCTVYSLYSYCSAEFRLTLSDITGIYTILGAVMITRSLPHCNRIHM